MVHLGMVLLKYLPCSLVDPLILMLGYLKYGDLSKYGICRPSKGPFSHKETSGRSPVIDIVTLGKIRAGEIQVHILLDLVTVDSSQTGFIITADCLLGTWLHSGHSFLCHGGNVNRHNYQGAEEHQGTAHNVLLHFACRLSMTKKRCRDSPKDPNSHFCTLSHYSWRQKFIYDEADDASRLRISSEFENELNVKSIYSVAEKTIGVRIQKAVDPDVTALLDETDSRFGSDVDELEEDFVVQANIPEEREEVHVVGESVVDERFEGDLRTKEELGDHMQLQEVEVNVGDELIREADEFGKETCFCIRRTSKMASRSDGCKDSSSRR